MFRAASNAALFFNITVSQLSDSNRRPAHYEGATLPSELSWLINTKLKLMYIDSSFLTIHCSLHSLHVTILPKRLVH